MNFQNLLICDRAFFSDTRTPNLINIFTSLEAGNLPAVLQFSAFFETVDHETGDVSAKLEVLNPQNEVVVRTQVDLALEKNKVHQQIVNISLPLTNAGSYTVKIEHDHQLLKRKFTVRLV